MLLRLPILSAAGEAPSPLEFPDYAILVGYFLLMLGVGLLFARHMRGIQDYFKGGNAIPWWLSGVSFYMTSFSVAAFVFYPSLCYRYGFVGVTLLWVAVPATLFSALLFGTRWRRARIVSPVEYLETRYSPLLRQLFAWQGIPVKLIDDALKLVSTGVFLSVFLGVEMKASLIGSALAMLLYTLMGGLWAVTVTDFLQFVVLSAAIVVVLPLSLREAGGIAALFRDAPPGFFAPTAETFDWVYVGCAVLLYALAWSSLNWSLIQRYYCVPAERDARKVGWTVVVLYIVGPPLMFLPALAARTFLPGLEERARDVYPLLCRRLLPSGMLGLVLAGMFAATMSTLSSDYNVCASVLTNDVWRRLFRPKASQRELLIVGRAMTLLVGLFALAAALAMAGGSGERLFRTMMTLFSLATAPVAIPMLLGLVSRRITAAGALAGFAAGLAEGLTIFLFGPKTLPILGRSLEQENLILLASAGVTLLVTLIVSLGAAPSKEEIERAESFHRRLATPIGDLQEDRPAREPAAISPFRVVGIAMALIGLLLLGILPWVWGETLALTIDAALGLAFIAVGLLLGLRSSSRPPTA